MLPSHCGGLPGGKGACAAHGWPGRVRWRDIRASPRALDWLLERAERPSPGAGPLSAGGLQKGSCRVWGSVGGGCRVSESPPTARGKSELGESPLAPVC